MKQLRSLVFCLFLLVLTSVRAQVTVPNATACPNQAVTLTATWNNVSNITYTLFTPGAGPGQPFVGNTFTISNTAVSQTAFVYTVCGSGNSGTTPVASCATLELLVVPPASLVLTNGANSGNYCWGDNGVITAPLGSATYTVLSGACYNNLISSSNIINLANLTTACNGIYTVVANMGGCIQSNTTLINVSSNAQIGITPPVTVCENDIVTINAVLQNGTNYILKDFNNTTISTGSAFSFTATPGNAGVYTYHADMMFAGIPCHRVASTTVTVIQKEQVIVSATPNTTVCEGTSLNLGATAGNGNPSFQWNGPKSFFSVAQNPVLTNVTINEAGTYSVMAIFGGICSTSAAINITVIPVSVPVITLTPDVCQNGNVNLSATAAGASSFQWNGPYFGSAGAPGANVPLVNVQPNASGTYYVTAKFGNGLCSVTQSAALNVVPVSEVQVVTPVTVCAPINAPLQANAAGANSFSWVGPNNFTTPGANVVVYNTSPKASGIYTVTAYFGGGNISCPNSNTVELTVNPTLPFSLVPRRQACFNDTLSIIGPAGATSYTWTSSTGYTSNNKDIFFTKLLPSDAGTYTLNVSLGPCKTSDETAVEVISPISFTLRPDSKTICLGDTIVMEAGVSGGSQNPAYKWNPPIYLDSPDGPKKVVSPEGTVIYNLLVYDIACPSFSLSHSFSVIVNEAPQPSLTLPYGEACQPYCFDLIPNTNGESVITTYDFGGLLQFQSSLDTVPYCLQDPGIYNLKVHSKGKNGCTGVYNYPVTITVHPKPHTQIVANPEFPTTVDEVVFTPVHGYDDIEGYRWMFSGGIDTRDTSKVRVKTPGTDTTTEKSPVRIFENVGTYPVMVISKSNKGCIDTAVKFLKVTDDLQIFVPNAFTPNGDGINDEFYVKGTGMETANYTLEVTDRWGVVVFFSRDINTRWDGTNKGGFVRDGVYTYLLKVVGMNGEGRKEISGHVVLLK